MNFFSTSKSLYDQYLYLIIHNFSQTPLLHILLMLGASEGIYKSIYGHAINANLFFLMFVKVANQIKIVEINSTEKICKPIELFMPHFEDI